MGLTPPLPPSDVQVLPDPLLRALRELGDQPKADAYERYGDISEAWRFKPSNCTEPWPATLKQARAIDCDADICMLGGAAGSLKTSSLLIDAVMERDSPTMRSYFFRRTYKELEGGDGAIDQAHRLFSQTGALGYNSTTHTWKWPSGAEFYFRHAQHEKDVFPYQGHAMSYLGIDESTHWPEKMVRYLITRNRSTDPDMKVRVRLGTNPGNVGHKWHMRLFMGGFCPHCEPDKAPPQWKWYPGDPEKNPTLRWDCRWPSDSQPLEVDVDGRKVRLSVAYILSGVRDHSLYPVEYQARLRMQSPATAKALLEGCWRIFEGQYFDVWEPRRGMKPGMTWKEALALPPGTGPMVVPRRMINEQWWWPRWVSSDYGFSISISAGHLWLHEPQSAAWPRGRVYLVDEHGCQETSENFAKILLDRWVLGEDRRPIEYRWMPWYLSPDAWAEKGVPFTIAGQMNAELARYHRGFVRADNDRAGGAVKMYTGFDSGELVICEECTKTIESIESRIHDPDKQDDVLKVSGDELDDYYDSARYGWKSFETARQVTTPAKVRIEERLKTEFEKDPTTAMFKAGKIREEELNRDKPTPYVSAGQRRRQLAQFERTRRS